MTVHQERKCTMELVLAVCLIISNGRLAAGEIEVRGGLAEYGLPQEIMIDNPLYAGRHLNEWIELLESDDEQRLGAARSLGDMGANAKGAVPGLIKSLADRDSLVRSAAAHSLGQIGPGAASAVPAMVTAFKRASGFDKGIIGPAIGAIGPLAVPALIELSQDSNENTRWEAVRAIRIVGPGAGAAEKRLNELLSDQSIIRVEAAFALWKIRPRPALINVFALALADPDEFARSSAADHLAEIGPDAVPAMPGLIRALADTSGSVRGLAARALGKFGPRAKIAVPALLRVAAHPGEWSTLNETVKRIGPEAVPALIHGLDDPEYPAGHVPAAVALGQFGPLAAAAVPRIRALLANSRGEARVSLAQTLWRIDRDSSALAVLIALIRKEDFMVQARAFDALEEIGPDAKAAIPMLIEMLDHKNRFLREHATKVLGRIGKEARTAVPALEKTLRDPVTSNRIEAAKALWRINRAQVALTTLFEEAGNVADLSHTFAVLALGEIGPEAKGGVPAMIEALNADTIWGKAVVAQAIGHVGPGAKAAIPRLIDIHNDLYNTERASFAEAIKAIDPEAGASVGIR